MQVFLVTGGNSGMGFETCRALALNNAQVVLVSRNEAAGHAAAQRIRSEYGRAHVDVAQCDLGDVSSIVGLVDEIKRSRAYAERGIHCIVNMAGVYQPGELLDN